MATYNHVTLVGNLTSAVELRHLPSGMAVADLRLAVSEKFKNKQGEMTDKPLFVDVVVWDKQAENCAKYLGRGSPVLVDGRLQMDEWTSKEGEKRSKIRIRANIVQFLGQSRGKTESAPDNIEEQGRPIEETPSDPDDTMPF